METSTITLRPQQIVFEDAIREAFRQHRCVLATAPTGFGKGVVIADMAMKSVQAGRKVLIVTNRRQIVLQLNEHCQRAGVHCGVIMGSEPQDREAPLQVASIQTLKRRGFSDLVPPGFIIVDECVSGDTLIDTERGTVYISDASPCKMVLSHGPNGPVYRRILRWLPRGKRRTLRLHFQSGRTIQVTAEHKFATNLGWIEAQCLTPQHKVICVNADAEYPSPLDGDSERGTGESSTLSGEMRNEKKGDSLRRHVSAAVAKKSACVESLDTATTFTDILPVSNAVNSTTSRSQNYSDVRFSGHFLETVQSDCLTVEAHLLGYTEHTVHANKSGCNTNASFSFALEHHGKYAIPLDMVNSPAAGEHGQSLACNPFTTSSRPTERKPSRLTGSIPLVESGLLGGSATMEAHQEQGTSPSTRRDTARTRTSLSKSGSPLRTGRPSFSKHAEGIPSSDFPSPHSRPSSPSSRTTFPTACGTSFDTLLSIEEADEIEVFDLEVEHDHCFYANGILVHNCHQENDAYRKLLRERFPKVRALGLTATPVGPGGTKIGHFDVIVEPIKNTQVIEAGDLLKVHPYLAPSEPDLGGINLKVASMDEVGRKVDSCTVYGDVFKEWEPFSSLQTMVVLPSRAVCNYFHQQCLERGITAKVVDGTTEQDERAATFREFKAEDCQMLLGVDVIREGLDLPIAQCLIDLQPTHQFRVYWQKLGRIKRPHPGQESAVVIDFAGNLWRHMVHPDQDPPWADVTSDQTIEDANERKAGVRCPKCGSRDIYGPNAGLYKCEDCGETWATKKPWVCPHCKQALSPWQKCVGGHCPNCGEKVSSKPVKRIRFENGEIRSVPSDEIKRRKKKNQDGEQQEWMKWVYIARGWNAKPENRNKQKKTLNWCAAMHQRSTGHWPRKGMKYMPDNPGDMKRAPEAVYPFLRKR